MTIELYIQSYVIFSENREFYSTIFLFPLFLSCVIIPPLQYFSLTAFNSFLIGLVCRSFTAMHLVSSGISYMSLIWYIGCTYYIWGFMSFINYEKVLNIFTLNMSHLKLYQFSHFEPHVRTKWYLSCSPCRLTSLLCFLVFIILWRIWIIFSALTSKSLLFTWLNSCSHHPLHLYF